jgi:hypothetical protein
MLTGSGLARTWPHDRAHAFFCRAPWSSDTLGLYLSRLIVRTLLPAAAALTVAVDDTLFKKRGRKVFGAGVAARRCRALGEAGRIRLLLRGGPGSWWSCRSPPGRCVCRWPPGCAAASSVSLHSSGVFG